MGELLHLLNNLTSCVYSSFLFLFFEIAGWAEAEWDLLHDNLLQSAQDLTLGQRFTFHQDNELKSLSGLARALTHPSWKSLHPSWQNVRAEYPKSRGAELVASYLRRPVAVIAAKGALTRY